MKVHSHKVYEHSDLGLARSLIDYEADLLDRLDYETWLELWTEESRYIVPIDRDEVEYATRLNHIYDDANMRKQRVERLLSGHAPSANPIMRTVRTTGRFRMLAADPDRLIVSSSLHIISFKRQVQTLTAADVTHELVRSDDGLKIEQKRVLLINSDEPLAEMSYLL